LVVPDRAFFAYTALLNAVTSLVLVVVVLTKSRRQERDLVFAGMCVSLAWWNFFYFLWMAANDKSSAIFLNKMIMLVAPVSAVLFLHFSVLLAETKKRYAVWVVPTYACVAIFGVMGTTPLISGDPRRVGVFPFWPTPGPFLPYQLGFFTVVVTVAFRELIGAFRKASGIRREQIRWVLYSALIAIPGSMLNYMPWFGIDLKPYGNAFIFVQISIIAYATLRYRLIDLNLAARNFLIYALFALIFAGPLLMAMVFARSILATAVISTVGVVVAPLFFLKVKESLERAVDQLPGFRTRYQKFQYGQVFFRRLEGLSTVSQWAEGLVHIVKDFFDLQKVSVFLLDEKEADFLVKASFGFSEGESVFLSFPKDSPVVRRLERQRECVIAETVEDIFTGEERIAAGQELAFLHAEIVFPIFCDERLKGILTVGAFTDGRMFNELDLALLGNLLHAAENSLRVVLCVREQQKNASLLAHDLMHPFLKGSFTRLGELLEGRQGPLTEEQRKVIGEVSKDASFVGGHLRQLVGAREKPLRLIPTSLNAMYEDVRTTFGPLCAQKNIDLEVDSPPESIKVQCDEKTLFHRLITNLLDNAIRHTPPGGTVSVGYALHPGHFVGCVKDTGPGIPKDAMKFLFQFGEHAISQGVRGSAGLGLYNVFQVVQAHHGRAWAESDIGKGSAFFFELPLV
jgi:signal transduction histidine kinase